MTLDWRASEPIRPDSGNRDPNGYPATPGGFGGHNQGFGAMPIPQAGYQPPYPAADGGAYGYQGGQPQAYAPYGSQVPTPPPAAFHPGMQEPYYGAPQTHDLGGDGYTPHFGEPDGQLTNYGQPAQPPFGGFPVPGQFAPSPYPQQPYPQQPTAVDIYGQPLSYGYGAQPTPPPHPGHGHAPMASYPQPNLPQQLQHPPSPYQAPAQPQGPGYGQQAPMHYPGQNQPQPYPNQQYQPQAPNGIGAPQAVVPSSPMSHPVPGMPNNQSWWTPDGSAPFAPPANNDFLTAPAMDGQAFGLLAAMAPSRTMAPQIPNVGQQGYFEQPTSTLIAPPETPSAQAWGMLDDAPRYAPPGSEETEGDPFGIRKIPEGQQVYRGPRIVPTDAFAGVAFGVLALVLFPVGLFGFTRSRRAKGLIASAPNRYKGHIVAVAGLTMNAISPIVSLGLGAAMFGFV